MDASLSGRFPGDLVTMPHRGRKPGPERCGTHFGAAVEGNCKIRI